MLEYKLKYASTYGTALHSGGKLNSGVSSSQATINNELLNEIDDFMKNRYKNDLNHKSSRNKLFIIVGIHTE